MSTEKYKTGNRLDISIHRNNNNLDISNYRKPTATDNTIQHSYNHPYEHKIAAFTYYTHRWLTLSITEEFRYEEWNATLTIANNNGYSINIIHNLKTRLIAKKQKQQQNLTTISHDKKWVKFTYLSTTKWQTDY